MYREPLSEAQDFLRSARLGMEVYDRDQNKVGKVIDIRFASDTIEETPSGVDDDLVGLHETVRARLMQSGFVKIATGLLRPDRYAMADQITYIDEEAIYLNVGRNSLIRA